MVYRDWRKSKNQTFTYYLDPKNWIEIVFLRYETGFVLYFMRLLSVNISYERKKSKVIHATFFFFLKETLNTILINSHNYKIST